MDNIKEELINDLIAITMVMEELWKYHPSNPNPTNIITEYEALGKIKDNIELNLDGLRN